MVIIDELPFRFMEGLGFKNFMYASCPIFKIPSSWTMTQDCYKMHVSKRMKLKVKESTLLLIVGH